jgi:hypothetical protein
MKRTPSGLILPRPTERRPRANGKRWSPTLGFGAVLEPDGSVAWQEDEWTLNALTDEGEQSMLNVYLKELANPAKHLCLIDGTTTGPTEASSMAYLGGGAGAKETRVPGVDGYGRQQVAGATDWTDDGLIGGDYRFSASQKTFGPATGTAWTINNAGMVTAATGQLAGSGKFILYLALSATTVIAVGQSFLYTLRFSQS